MFNFKRHCRAVHKTAVTKDHDSEIGQERHVTYHCPNCLYTTKRFNDLKRHVKVIHNILIKHPQDKPSQEDHQYGKRFKDASTQYSENDINHSTTPYLIPSVCVCKERKPFIVYNAEVINEKNVQFRKELFQKMGAEIVSIMESNFLPLMK